MEMIVCLPICVLLLSGMEIRVFSRGYFLLLNLAILLFPFWFCMYVLKLSHNVPISCIAPIKYTSLSLSLSHSEKFAPLVQYSSLSHMVYGTCPIVVINFYYSCYFLVRHITVCLLLTLILL